MFEINRNCLGNIRKPDELSTAPHNSDNPFVIVSKKTIFDKQVLEQSNPSGKTKSVMLSLSAIGFLAFAFSHREGQKFTFDYMKRVRGVSRREYNAIIKELEQFGYAEVIRTSKNGVEKMMLYECSINEPCDDCPDQDADVTEQDSPCVQNEHTQPPPCVQNEHTIDIKDSSVSPNGDTDSTPFQEPEEPETKCDCIDLDDGECRELCLSLRFFTKWAMAIKLPEKITLPTQRQAIGRANHLHKTLTKVDPTMDGSKFKAFAVWLGFIGQSQAFALKWTDKVFVNKYAQFCQDFGDELLAKLRGYMVLDSKMSALMYEVVTPKTIMIRTAGIVGLLERDDPLVVEGFEIYFNMFKEIYAGLPITENTLSDKLDSVRAYLNSGENE